MIGAAIRCVSLSSAIILATCTGVRAQEDYQVLVDSVGPGSNMVKAADGNFYGTSSNGFYRLTPDGVYSVISPSCCGAGHITPGSDGNLYFAGSNAIVAVSLDGTTTLLHVLQNSFSDGLIISALVEGDDGNFYGTTKLNGTFQLGTAFRISVSGVFETLHSFTPDEGTGEYSRLVNGHDGYLYGTLGVGLGFGTIFRMSLDGTTTTLHVFTGGPGGELPRSLVAASDGNFYGAAALGGAYGQGIVFRLCADGTFTLLYSFTGNVPPSDGIGGLLRPLMEASDGNLYGSDSGGGIYRITKSGDFRLLSSTTVNSYPNYAGNRRYGSPVIGELAEGPNGDLFGAVEQFGPGLNNGVLFRLHLQRSACADVVKLARAWSGTLSIIGALKSETPAFMAGFFTSSAGVVPLWIGATPPVTPTATFELPLPLPSIGVVGLFTLVMTSDSHVCADWSTWDTGGAGPSIDDLKGLLLQSGLVRAAWLPVR